MLETREKLATFIYNSLLREEENIKASYLNSFDTIGYFFLDKLLPEKIAIKIYENFPKLEESFFKKNIREQKYIAYKMDKYNKNLEEIIYAFQDERIVSKIAQICNLSNVTADENLYAGGLSLMTKDSFLNPHIDNSHDKDMNRWRVLNLLYYVTPKWKLENGGNLELWSNGIDKKPIIIESKFNRLVVMATHKTSWHSVNKVKVDRIRCCVSNYYFSKESIDASKKFHVTTFRARPEEKSKKLVLKTDSFLRTMLRKVFKKGIKENPHQYKK